ncbi:phage holin family protein [Limnobaculum zhutongyuii]|uniref:Phage holin family protein n=1 Tax=Limnobaculum zhutongyuii TaxID=2498113 RepID=A0A411WIH9_9GAMM|nr:phage holin family protein [Limnobaculum zhutongyuii]QBH95980.1 phage holin family protein [Limnobaculum zhutongyuii]TQS89310.1 phage holin family protein [Limnobaculum zhutongyuii]
MFDNPLLAINVVICALIIIRLMTFRRGNKKHNPTRAYLSYFLAVACFVVIVRIVFKQYVYIDWAETVLNLVLCIAIYSAKGNISELFKTRRRGVK